MCLRLLLMAGAVTLSLGASAQGVTFKLPSTSDVQFSGSRAYANLPVALETTNSRLTAAGGWSTAALTFRIDTRYADLVFRQKVTGDEYRISASANQGISNYLRASSGISGLSGGTVTKLSANQYQVSLLIAGADSAPLNTANIWRTGRATDLFNDQLIKLELNFPAINRDLGGMYQIEYVLGDKTRLIGRDAQGSFVMNGAIAGGKFVTPEPGAWTALAFGLIGLMRLKRRR